MASTARRANDLNVIASFALAITEAQGHIMKRISTLIGLLTLTFMLAAGSVAGYTPMHIAAAPSTFATTAIDCEGNACSQVALTWDETQQQYKAQNNSPDHWVRVEAANMVASVSICVAAGKSEYLIAKSIVGSYHANFDDTTCRPTTNP
jgi:hypothetical protein